MQADPRRSELRQGWFTAAGAILLGLGLFLLLYSLYHESARLPMMLSALPFLGAVICWMGSAASAPAD
jgi:hypothetical protein